MISKKNILYFFYIALGLGTGIGYGSIYLFHISLVLLLLISFDGKTINIYPTEKVYTNYLKFFFLWNFISMFWSYEFTYSITYSVYILIGLTIVFLSIKWIRNEETLKKILRLLSYVVLIEIIICLLEIFTPFRFPTSPYSEYAGVFGRKQTDFNLFQNETSLFIKTVPTGFFSNPNQLAIFFAMLSPFVFFFKFGKYKIFLILAIITILIYSGSRGSLISFILGFVIYLLLTVPIRRVLVFSLPIVFLYSIFISRLDVLKQSENSRIADIAYLGETLNDYLFEESVDEGSISYRKQLINNGLNALYETNGLGVGGGASVKVQEDNPVGFSGLTSMHNFWIEILVEGGVLLFITFSAWYFTLSFRLLKLFKKLENDYLKKISGALFISMIVFAIACVSASSVIYFLPMWLMFGMVLSFLTIINTNRYVVK